jgi:hypothetical protein
MRRTAMKDTYAFILVPMYGYCPLGGCLPYSFFFFFFLLVAYQIKTLEHQSLRILYEYCIKFTPLVTALKQEPAVPCISIFGIQGPDYVIGFYPMRVAKV